MDNLSVFHQFQQLPYNIQEQVADFIAYLSSKYVKKQAEVKPIKRKSGTLKGLIVYMSEDFNEYR